jgi:hypothetical protein
MVLSPNEAAVRLLGPEAASWAHEVEILVPNLKGFEYTFMPDTQFQQLIVVNTTHAMEVYWRELLYRAHFAAATSIIRMHGWLAGTIGAANSANFLTFCAAFRGLLEASADSFETLNRTAPTLADAHNIVRNALAGQQRDVVLSSLEEQLIHFSHGRRLQKGEDAPKSHRAKQATQYIASLQSNTQDLIVDCYSNLCEYTHPSALSVLCYTEANPDRTRIVLQSGNDNVLIEDFCEQYRAVMLPLVALGFVPALMTLRVLNRLPLTALHVPLADSVDLSRSEGWHEIDARLRDLRGPALKPYKAGHA